MLYCSEYSKYHVYHCTNGKKTYITLQLQPLGVYTYPQIKEEKHTIYPIIPGYLKRYTDYSPPSYLTLPQMRKQIG